MKLHGIHHLTAVTARARENLQFYTQTLGMRLVKKTVNQDDVRAYHLFYADGLASPGCDLTFFDWADAPPEQHGSFSLTRTGLRVRGEGALAWWAARLEAAGVRHSGLTTRDGRQVLDFLDFEGQRLSLVDDEGRGPGEPWEGSPLPGAYQIRGLGPASMSIAQHSPTDLILTQVLGMRPVRQYPDPQAPQHTVHVYEMAAEGPAAELHVAVRPDLPPVRPGAGGVHHVAFRVPDFEEHLAWERHLRALRIQTSGIIDRFYFRSIYFRLPSGVLFELATDGPGFAVDEPAERLGERLALPPFLEPRRAEIEANLQPLTR